jgi:cytochrome c2
VFQSLCHECHSYKTGKERKGTFIHYTPEGEKNLTKDDYAYTMARVNAGNF